MMRVHIFRNWSDVWDKQGKSRPVGKISYVKLQPQWGWMVGAGLYVDDIDDQLNRMLYTTLGVLAAVVAATLLLVLVIARSISTKGTEIATDTAAELEEIVARVVKVTELVGEIATASNEQAEGIAQVNEGLGQIDQVTQQNTTSAEESAAAAEELSGQAFQLKEMLQGFTLETQAGAGVSASH